MRFPFDSYDKLFPRESKVVTNPNIIEKMVEISDETTEPTDETNDIVDETTEPNGGTNGD